MGRSREENALVAPLGAAADLRRGGLHIPEGRRHDGDEAARIRSGPLEQPVVVGLHTRQHQLGLFQPQEALVPEAADVRVQGHGPDPHLVHVLQPRHRVVGRLGNLVHVERCRRKGLGPARHRRVSDGYDTLSIAEGPYVRTIGVALDSGGTFPPLLGKPLGPDVPWFRDVRIDVDDPVCDLHGSS